MSPQNEIRLKRFSSPRPNCPARSGGLIIDEVDPELSLLRTRVRQERVNDYLAAVKKSGLKSYMLVRSRYGAPSSEARLR